MSLPHAPSAPAADIEAPRLSLRQAAIRVVVGLALLGALLGVVWAWLAPPIQVVVALTKSGERVQGYLGDDSDFVFLGAFLMTGLLFVLAVSAAVATWQWRAHRGPVMVGALSSAPWPRRERPPVSVPPWRTGGTAR